MPNYYPLLRNRQHDEVAFVGGNQEPDYYR
jgi:hypothetical protein